ncbi:MAG: amidohydrolase family protein [Hyphomicrobiales bacterium]|nr:amidohydrolase family protein [Alphaproteobacteria bacterium]
MSLIDVHHHIVPPAYAERVGPRLASRNKANAAQVMRWTTAGSIEAMDRAGIDVSITSISTPGVWFGDVALAKRLARDSNEFAAGMERDYPGRFGFFATLPMPDIDAALEEISYAFDTLRADGVGLMSNYGRVWPGDPKFAPVFDELNRRRAIVYVHPILPEACQDMMPGVGESALEYLFDTARAITSLLYNGSLLRWPDLRFIFPHAGGAMPPLAARVTRMADRDRTVEPKPAQGCMSELDSLYFDVASSTNPVTLTGLLKLVPATQVMFGTDYPFLSSIPYTLDPLRSHGLSAADLQAIESGTALRLFPRFAKGEK